MSNQAFDKNYGTYEEYKRAKKNYKAGGSKSPSVLWILIKAFICFIVVIFDIALIFSSIATIADDIDYYYNDSNKYEYCEKYYDLREWEELYNELTLYNCTDKRYDKFWEMCEFYIDYLSLCELRKQALEDEAGLDVKNKELDECTYRLLGYIYTTEFPDNKELMRGYMAE